MKSTNIFSRFLPGHARRVEADVLHVTQALLQEAAARGKCLSAELTLTSACGDVTHHKLDNRGLLRSETMKRIEQGRLRMFRDQRPITQFAEMAPPEEFFRWGPSTPIPGAENLKRAGDLPDDSGLELLKSHGFPTPEPAAPAEPTASED